MSNLWNVEQSDALEWARRQPTRSCSLVMFSPPYENQRTYGIGCKLIGQAWVDWLRPIVVESARVSDGLVIVNAAGAVRKHSYSPVMEWLVADLTRIDGLVCGPSPFVWWKVCGIPGSGNDRYQRRDWEPLYAFCLPDRLPLKWTNNTAFGHPPKCGPGGEFSNRTVDGERVNASPGPIRRSNGEYKDVKRDQLANSPGTNRKANGERKRQIKMSARMPDGRRQDDVYLPATISNPGNVIITDETDEPLNVDLDAASDVITARVGGGHLGHASAHRGEAPMCLGVAERFVRWYAAPGSVVGDPFAGTGTTAHAAIMHSRKFVGCDVRQSMVDLTNRRLLTVALPMPGMITDHDED